MRRRIRGRSCTRAWLLATIKRHAEYIYNRLLTSSPSELPVIWGILHQHDGEAPRLGCYWKTPRRKPTGAPACAWRASMGARRSKMGSRALRRRPPSRSRAQNPGDYPVLIETLPLRARLVPPLSLTFGDRARADSDRSLATSILADYAAADPARLAELLMSAEPKQYAKIFPVAQKVSGRVLPILQSEIETHDPRGAMRVTRLGIARSSVDGPV